MNISVGPSRMGRKHKITTEIRWEWCQKSWEEKLMVVNIEIVAILGKGAE